METTTSVAAALAALAMAADAAIAQDVNAPALYGSVSLRAGFLPDPHVVEVAAGGDDRARGIGAECVGYIDSQQPDFNLFYVTGRRSLTILVDGSLDTTLIVNDPDGGWHCNDDFSDGSGGNPALVFETPLDGRYDIWVGQFEKVEPTFVNLVITERPVPWQGDTVAAGDIDWGDNASPYASDRVCDDPRFVGPGMTRRLLESDRHHDAEDCRRLYEDGRVALADPDAPIHEPREDSEPGLLATGTGFFVGRSGHVLTNHYVIEECSTTAIKLMGEPTVAAVVVSTNEANDLALLKADFRPDAVAAFRGGSSVRQGEEVVAYGFPHYGQFSSQGNLTDGLITALSGFQDDLRFLQISAPVQAGNSGGPLMDRSGNIVGVVVAKADALLIAEESGGDLIQNVNFAIRGSLAQSFLDTNNVDYDIDDSTDPLAIADIGERAQDFTALILCFE